MIRILRRCLLFVAIAACAAGIADGADWPTLKKGDVFVTRNPLVNIVPGYWNHTAIYDGNGSVIEAQLSDNRVRRTPLATFYNRYSQIRVYRLNSQYLVPRMVQYANSLVGQPYTIFPGRGGYSCVMVIRTSFYFATLAYVQGGIDPGWLIPDNIASDGRFSYVGQK